jgi:hypothetical protein
VNHFGPMIAADLRKRRPKPHTTWHLDEVYLKIGSRARVQPRDFFPPTPPSTTPSTSSVISSQPAPTAGFALLR